MPQPLHRSICWIRRDIRLWDHAALAAATDSSAFVAVAFVFDSRILSALPDPADRRITFIHRSLQELDRRLRARGSALVVRVGDPREEIPQLAEEFGAEAVFAARDYEPYATARDSAIQEGLALSGRRLVLVKDSVVLEADELSSHSGPYRKYAPFANAWRKAVLDALHVHEARLERLAPLENLPKSSGLPLFSLSRLGFEETESIVRAGEDEASHELECFKTRIGHYAEKRDETAGHATSRLSPHLRFGTISVRECVRTALESGEKGEKWIGELIWREYFQSILCKNPGVAEEPFQCEFRDMRYPGDPDHFDAWRQGRTGYPLVDASMRCLNATGWIPNRQRMVAASFLCKDLLLDYRLGERYFADKLLDFDLASNNGNWQWVASVGAEAQPSFRVMNPIVQSERFDLEGEFIRAWLPELASLSSSAIHFPCRANNFDLLSVGVRLGEDYPLPIVDHAVQRRRAMEMFQRNRGIARGAVKDGEIR